MYTGMQIVAMSNRNCSQTEKEQRTVW